MEYTIRGVCVCSLAVHNSIRRARQTDRQTVPRVKEARIEGERDKSICQNGVDWIWLTGDWESLCRGLREPRHASKWPKRIIDAINVPSASVNLKFESIGQIIKMRLPSQHLWFRAKDECVRYSIKTLEVRDCDRVCWARLPLPLLASLNSFYLNLALLVEHCLCQ